MAQYISLCSVIIKQIRDVYMTMNINKNRLFNSVLSMYSHLFNMTAPTTFHFYNKNSQMETNVFCFDSVVYHLDILSIGQKLPLIKLDSSKPIISSSLAINMLRSVFYIQNEIPVYKYYQVHQQNKPREEQKPLIVLLVLPPEKQGYYRKYIRNYRDLYARIASNSVQILVIISDECRRSIKRWRFDCQKMKTF